MEYKRALERDFVLYKGICIYYSNQINKKNIQTYLTYHAKSVIII